MRRVIVKLNNTYVDYIFLIFIGVDDNSFVL